MNRQHWIEIDGWFRSLDGRFQYRKLSGWWQLHDRQHKDVDVYFCRSRAKCVALADRLVEDERLDHNYRRIS